MTDLFFIEAVKEYMSDCHLEYPTIEIAPELKGYQKQPCGIAGVEWEYVKQDAGGGIGGDTFTGKKAFPVDVGVGEAAYLIVEYCT